MQTFTRRKLCCPNVSKSALTTNIGNPHSVNHSDLCCLCGWADPLWKWSFTTWLRRWLNKWHTHPDCRNMPQSIQKHKRPHFRGRTIKQTCMYYPGFLFFFEANSKWEGSWKEQDCTTYFIKTELIFSKTLRQSCISRLEQIYENLSWTAPGSTLTPGIELLLQPLGQTFLSTMSVAR